MPYLTGLAEALRSAGLRVIERDGWRTRGKLPFEPRGVLAHHTGPFSSVDGMVSLCINGRSDLPGPLAHTVLDPSGVWHVISAGRANHAGRGIWHGLDSNTQLVGVEAMHPGDRSPWPDVQLESYWTGMAAICRLLGCPAELVAGHKEYCLPKGRKPDPVTLDMNVFRDRVRERLHGYTPTIQLPQEHIMPDPQFAGANAPLVAMHVGPDWYALMAADGAIYAFGPGAIDLQKWGGVRYNKQPQELWLPRA